MAGLDLQVFEGPAHLDPEVKRGPALKKNISLYPVTLISAWKWGADLNSQGPLLRPPSYLSDYVTMRLYDLNCLLSLITDEDEINHAKEKVEYWR